MIMQKHARKASSLDDLVIHLLHRVSQNADDIFDKEVTDDHLTPRQFVVLLAVAESEDPSHADLVEATGIDRATIAEMIGRMVKRGLLLRRRTRRDARAYVVHITEAGQRALKSAEPQAERAGAVVLAHLSNEQRKNFIDTLKAIATS
jgi:MarR family transcriptional regulator, temperature-dependent positive regulator of motility